MATAPTAGQVRAAEQRTDTEPTEAQKRDSNYAKGSFSWHGLKIAVENPKGSVRSGVGKDGKPWSVVMPCTYGEIKKTEGMDEDPVDAFVGPDHDSERVFVIDQVDAKSKRPDEHKVMLSFRNKASALQAYEGAFSDGKGRERIGAVTELSVPGFKHWLVKGSTEQPMVKQRESLLARAKRFAMGGRVQSFDTGGSADNDVLQAPLLPIPNMSPPPSSGGGGGGGGSMAMMMLPMLLAQGGRVQRFAGGGESAADSSPNLDEIINRGGFNTGSILDKMASLPEPLRYVAHYREKAKRQLAAAGRDPDAASYQLLQRFADIADRKENESPEEYRKGALKAGAALLGPIAAPYLGAAMAHPAVSAALLAPSAFVPARRDEEAPPTTGREALFQTAPYWAPFAAGKVLPSAGNALAKFANWTKETAVAHPFGAPIIGGGVLAAGLPAEAQTPGTPQLPPQQREQIETRLNDLLKERATWRQRYDDADNRMKQEAFRGGRWIPSLMQENYRNAERDRNKAQAEMEALKPRIDQYNEMTTPEYARKQADAELARQEAIATKARYTPWGERPENAWLNEHIPDIALGTSLALPYAARFTSQMFRNMPIWRFNRMVKEAEEASRVGDTHKLATLVPQINAALRAPGARQPGGSLHPDEAGHPWPNYLAAGITGFASGAEGYAYPHRKNATILPDMLPDIRNPDGTITKGGINQFKLDEAERARDPWAILESGWLPAITGAGTQKIPVPRAQPKIPQAQGLVRRFDVPGGPTTAFERMGLTPRPMIGKSPSGEGPQPPTTPPPTGGPAGPGGPRPPVQGGPLSSAPTPGPTPEPTQLQLPGPPAGANPPATPAPGSTPPSPPPTTPKTRIIKETKAGTVHIKEGHEPEGYVAGQFAPKHIREGTEPPPGWKPPHERDKGKGASGQGAEQATDKGTPKKSQHELGKDEKGNPIYGDKPLDEGKATGGRVASYVRRMLGGRVYKDGGRVLSGALDGPTGGRADEVPGDVRAGSFVIPADVVAGRGQGNTQAGQKWFDTFEQYAMKTAGHRINHEKLARASGGAVKARVAHGERIIAPEVVAAVGNGDLDDGHNVLDDLVQRWRAEDIKTLKSLPPPVKS